MTFSATLIGAPDGSCTAHTNIVAMQRSTPCERGAHRSNGNPTQWAGVKAFVLQSSTVSWPTSIMSRWSPSICARRARGSADRQHVVRYRADRRSHGHQHSQHLPCFQTQSPVIARSVRAAIDACSAPGRCWSEDPRRGAVGGVGKKTALKLTWKWWSGRESNPRPMHCERIALPTELPPPRAARFYHRTPL